MTETYEEWRVTGRIAGEPYAFTWSGNRPDFADPESHARKFLALIARMRGEAGLQSELTLEHRTVTVTEWEPA